MVLKQIQTHPIHLGLGAQATSEPVFGSDVVEWYASYSKRHASDGAEGRLVSMYSFKESWTTWEMHPSGDEVVLCTAGSITLHQESADGKVQTVVLAPGEYTINAPGVWHTADVAEEATVLFITAGLGTEHRPR